MDEWIGVLAAVGSAGAWHAAAASSVPRRWWALAAAALLASVWTVHAAALDVASWWLVPLGAWLAGATAIIVARPFAPRTVDAVTAGCAALGIAGALADLGWRWLAGGIDVP